MRPEEAGGFPDMTVKVKCYFGKCEKKIDKFRRLFFTYSLEFSFHFVFHSYTILNKELFSPNYLSELLRSELTRLGLLHNIYAVSYQLFSI